MNYLKSLNPYSIYWGVIITNERLFESRDFKTTYLLEDSSSFTTRFSKIGTNVLVAPFRDKESAQKRALELMQKHKLAGQIITITEKQFSLKESAEVTNEDFRPKVNLSYTITIFGADKNIILPVTKKQFEEIITIKNQSL